MHHSRLVAAAMVAIATGTVSCSLTAPRHATPFELSNAATSAEQLADRVVAALARRDDVALQALRMTEREYNDLIVPGTVDPGQPPRQNSPYAKQIFWNLLDQRSQDFGRALLDQYGGKRLTRVGEIKFVDAAKRYAWYDALGQLRIPVRDQDGGEALIRTGWVAAVNGRYKLIGLAWDD